MNLTSISSAVSYVAETVSRISSPLFRCSTRRFASRGCIATVMCIALAILTGSRPVRAQSFSEAINAQLGSDPQGLACGRLLGGGSGNGLGTQLSAICGQVGLDTGKPNSTTGAGASPVTGVVYQRLRALREYTCDQGDIKCRPKGSGASADADLGGGVSVFASTNSQDLNRDKTAFEDGYDSDLWGLTAGAEYALSDALAVGLALNYTRWDGSFDSGGHFDKNAYGPVVYATFFPQPGVSAYLALGYNRIDISSRRRRIYVNEAVSTTTSGGDVSGNPDDNEFSTSFLLAVDYPIRQFTVGPRLGLDFVYTDFDAYTEKGHTGLELKFDSDSQTSLQSRLGLQASMAVSTAFGVLVPQLGADWVHEYANDQRSISVQFAQDNRPDPATFSFETEKPDRYFFEINAGISTVLPHGIQAFVNFWTLQGNKFLDSTAGSVGVRIDF